MSQPPETSNEVPLTITCTKDEPIQEDGASIPSKLWQIFTGQSRASKSNKVTVRSSTRASRRPSSQEILAQSHLEDRASEMGFRCPNGCVLACVGRTGRRQQRRLDTNSEKWCLKCEPECERAGSAKEIINISPEHA